MTILFAGDVPYHFVRHDSPFFYCSFLSFRLPGLNSVCMSISGSLYSPFHGWKWKILRHTVSRILYKTPVDKSDCDLYNLNNFKTTL